MSELIQISQFPASKITASSDTASKRLARKTTPIIKVVGDFCNLQCDYCFYHGKDQLTSCVMPFDLLEKFIHEFFELFDGDVRFIWHGGEPLLAGKLFFRAIIDFQSQYRKPTHIVRNTVQTNATLVDDEWATFFKESDFHVGVSLDGGAISHDMFRKNAEGRGSHADVLRGIKTLRKHGVEPGIIQTLTHETISRTAEDFSFFADTLGLKGWGINTFYAAASNAKEHDVSNEEFAGYLKQCVDLWLEQGDVRLRSREIENFMAGILGKRPRLCIFNGSCASYVCLEHDGRVYPCDRLSGRPEFFLGDLQSQSLEEILNGAARASYASAVETLHPDCAACEWQAACHNGCTHHRVGGISGKYNYCAARKEVFSYLREKVGALVASANQ
jgi:uncharacterized protein